MKSNLFQCLLVSVALLLASGTGCSKSGANQAILDPSKVPETVNNAFSNAPGETKEAAASCVASFQSQHTAAAFSKLRQMSDRHDLTPQQRQAVAKALQTTFLQMQTAAQNGDTAAQATMHNYLSTR